MDVNLLATILWDLKILYSYRCTNKKHKKPPKLIACFGKWDITNRGTEPEVGPIELSAQNEVNEIGSSGPYTGDSGIASQRGNKYVNEIGSST